jgi:Ca-activated chloride channel family protein
VALVLDRSGSMGGNKIRLAREAVRQGLQALRPDDRFTLVAYDDEVNVVVEATHATAEAKRNAVAKLGRIDARGSTDLHGGWAAGCEQLAAKLKGEEVGRVLLLTDGLANCGVTDRDELVRLAAAAVRDRRIATSTFGVGADFDERLLQGMAEAADGHFYFIETPEQIPDLLTSELGELLEVTAHEAAINIELPAGTEAAPLTALGATKTQSGIRIAVGNLVSGQEVEVVVAFRFPQAAAGVEFSATVGLSDRDNVLPGERGTLTWAVASDAVNDAQARDLVVDRAVAALYAAKARAEALELNRAGEFTAARKRLEDTARRILAYAGGDLELLAIAAALMADAEEHAAYMDAADMKRRHFASYSIMTNRAPDGKAKRRKP